MLKFFESFIPIDTQTHPHAPQQTQGHTHEECREKAICLLMEHTSKRERRDMIFWEVGTRKPGPPQTATQHTLFNRSKRKHMIGQLFRHNRMCFSALHNNA